MASKAWPTWWRWELEFVPHLLKRMADRDFDEIIVEPDADDELLVVITACPAG